jgi:uncharacterized membrane protein
MIGGSIGWFAVFSGVWGLAMIAIFIQAIRLSYRVEARSPDLVNRSGVPQRAKLVHTVANWKVARDPETQGLRRRMNSLLLVNLAGFVLFWIVIVATGSFQQGV